jgi:hypothetical protein
MSERTDGPGEPPIVPPASTRERFLQIVRGDPTPEEIAALVAVLTARARARAASGDGPPKPERSAWSDPSRRLRRPLPHGPGAWRSSAFPG